MPILGLDLGKHTLRAVELERSRDKITLLKFGTYENPKIDLDSDSKDEATNYSNAIKKFVIDMGFTAREVVISLPEQHIFMRVINVPKMSDKDLHNSIQYEAEQYIPLPLKEVNLSYQKMDADYPDMGKMNVQLVAAKKTVLEKYVNLVKGAKLTPLAMEPETLSIGRSLGDRIDKPIGTIILNIGYNDSLILVTYKGFVMFTRNIGVGGDTLTKAIQQQLNLDYTQAEEYKKVYGMDSNQVDGKIFNVLHPLFDNIVNEIKRSRIFFTTHNPNVTINRVILSGGTALMPGLLFYMANNLDLEVELANPWKNIVLSPKLDSQRDFLLGHGAIYSTPVGLALKEV